MPLPMPNKGESEKEFIARFMEFEAKEGKLNLKDEGDKKQALAIAYSQWEKKTESVEIKTFSQILTEKV